MNILFVGRTTPSHHLGGMEIVAWDLAKEFARLGHEIHYLTTKLEGGEKIEVKDIKIHYIDSPSGRYSRSWWRKSVEFLRANPKFEVVLGIGGGAHALAENSDEFNQTSIFIQSHGTPWGEIKSKIDSLSWITPLGVGKNLYYLVRDWRLAKYRAIIAIGPAVSESLNKKPMSWLTGKAKIETIENGINSDAFKFNYTDRLNVRRKFKLDLTHKVVISVSRLIRQKGIFESIKGFNLALQKQKNLRYLILGDGRDRDSALAYVEQLGLGDYVFFLGNVQRADLPSILSASDVFLFTTLRQEGLAIAPLEAAANGLDLVMSKHLVVPEINFASVDPLEHIEVSTALIDVPFSASMTVRKSKLPDRYTLEYAAKKYLETFDNCASKEV